MTDIIVANQDWGETAVPDWMKDKIIAERRDGKGNGQATDAECVAYLCSASLSVPFSHDAAAIYKYVFKAMCDEMGMQNTVAINAEPLTSEQEKLLADLREVIYKARVKAEKRCLHKKGNARHKDSDVNKEAVLND